MNQSRAPILPSLLPLLLAVTAVTTITPAWAADLDAYARATAYTIVNDMGPQQNFAAATAQANGPYAQQDAACMIGVARTGGWTWGPMEVPFGGPASWWGISAKVFGWPPPAVAGTASAYGWFESAEPFRIVVDGASVVVKASGMSASSGTLGFRVIDGETVVYDVAVEWGWTTEGPYFREVNLLGAWPNSWHTVQEFYALISQVGEFEMTFYPAGLARAEFYVDVEMVALAPTAAESESTSELSDTVSGAFIRPTHIPVSSKWGLTALALLLMAAGAGLIVRRCL